MPDDMVQYTGGSEISRMLTGDETHLAYKVFGPALHTERERIHNRAYLPWQQSRVAMTPNGELYFCAEDYKPDFSHDEINAAWLLHELTHAWQDQTSRRVKWRGLFEQAQELPGHCAYHYGRLDTRRLFASYKNERQAAIVEDYYRTKQHMPRRFGSGTLEDYEAAIPFVS